MSLELPPSSKIWCIFSFCMSLKEAKQLFIRSVFRLFFQSREF